MNDTVSLIKEKTVIAARKAAPYVWPVTRFTLIWTARIYAWFLIMYLWFFQFVIFVPAHFALRLLAGVTLSTGVIVLLVCIPIAGWIVLAFLLYLRAKHGTVMGEPNYHTRPWLLDPLLAIGR